MKDISLRDYFAGQAIQGILGASAIVYYSNDGQSCGTLAAHAEDAYRMADAMLAAREAVPQSNNSPTASDPSNSPTDPTTNRDGRNRHHTSRLSFTFDTGSRRVWV